MKTIIIDGIEYNLTPKVLFKKGDWVVSPNGVYWHIDAINNNRYEVSSTDGTCADWSLDTDLYHLWTIQEAKEGDVLAVEPIEGYPSSFVTIYKKQNGEDFDSYCFVGFDGKFYKGENGHSTEEIHPATKEQCGTLERAMVDAGYVFDFEKKELKKIEQKPATWTKEDERIYQSIMDDTVQENQLNDEQTNWLKDIKYRYFQQPKSDWSEEDEQYLLVCKNALAKYQVSDKWDANIISRWLENRLKSLRPQNTWKPSEEQMEALLYEVNAWDENSANGQNLKSLYEQLKKLREE